MLYHQSCRLLCQIVTFQKLFIRIFQQIKMEGSEASGVSSSAEDLEGQLIEQLILHNSTTSSEPDSDHGSGGGGGSDNPNQLVENAIEKLQFYCAAMDDMIETGNRFMNNKNEQTTLREIRRHMSTVSSSETSGGLNSNNGRYAVIEDNVPEELKCPVCFEIFEDEVLQCVNGHSTCIRCCDTLSECPECRANYNDGKIRNRTVEKLMNTLKIDCIYSDAGCGEKLICAEMQVHVETCSYMNKPVRSPEYKEIRKQVKSIDGHIKRMEKRLEESNKRLIETKSAWKSAHCELCSSFTADSGPVKFVERSAITFDVQAREHELTRLYEILNVMIT